MMTAQDLIRPDGTVALDALLAGLGLTEAELALALGMSQNSLATPPRSIALASQRKLRDFVEILMTVVPWAGSLPQAFDWFSTQPLASFGNRTAADLVRKGRAEAVKSHISRIAIGGYA